MLDGFGLLVTAIICLFSFLKPMLQHKVLSQQQIGSLAVSTHIKPIHTYTGWWFGT
jgi:sorbitol-specific phosphotransferase system component IIBC